MSKTITIVMIVIAGLVFVVGSIKKMINDKAKYEALQDQLAVLDERVAAENRDVARLVAMLREDSALIDSLNADLAARDERLVLLAEDSLAMGLKLTEIRAARYQADETLAALRGTVNEDRLPRPVQQLLVAERSAGDVARQEAEACDDLLGNCEERSATLQGKVGTLETEAQVLQKDLDSARVELFDMQALSKSQDSAITDLNDQLRPSFWKSATSKEFLTGAGAGALAILVLRLIFGG
jgi:chromosome segregation ATPase